MGQESIAATGNTEVPAYLTLIALGYSVDRSHRNGDERWIAKKGTLQLVANGPLELLGLSLLRSERGPRWQASDGEIGEFLRRFSARNQVIETKRLRLEPYAPAHSTGLNALEQDPEVMRFIGNGTTKSLEETEAAIKRAQERWEKLGYSWWAIFNRESNELIGAACLQHLANKDGAPLEIGWRLRLSDHGKGFATEAGRGVIKFAFERIGASHLVAVAHPENRPSHRVMERLGMTYVGIEDHYNRRCVVYELRRSESSAAEP